MIASALLSMVLWAGGSAPSPALCIVRPPYFENGPECVTILFPGVLHDYPNDTVIANVQRPDGEPPEHWEYEVEFCFQGAPDAELVCYLRYDLMIDSFEDR
jgi:hypothetical protein